MNLLSRNERIENTNGMDMYHGLLFKDMVTGKSQLKDVTDTEDKNYQMLLLTLVKFLVSKHYKLKVIDDWMQWKKEKPTENFFQSCANPFVGDQELSEYFVKFCEKLLKMMEAIENPSETIRTMATPGDPDPEKPEEPEPASSAELSSFNMKMILTQSHTFIYFFDISLNKAAYEVVFLLGSTYKSVVLLNCLNLFYYTESSESMWKYQTSPLIQRRKVTCTAFTEHSNISSTMLRALLPSITTVEMQWRNNS